MPFDLLDTALPDVKIVRPRRFEDARGWLAETWKQSDFDAAGLPRFVQDNGSLSTRGVIRGLHHQLPPHAQGKLIACVTGRIYDVALDVRPASSTFGRWVAVELSEHAPDMLFIPAGFAHGFQALEDRTRVTYKFTTAWCAAAERTIHHDDPALAIPWPLAPRVLSPKDRDAPLLSESELGPLDRGPPPSP